MEEISVNLLLNILKNEKKTGELVTLPQNFYSQVYDKIKSYGPESDEVKSMQKTFSSIREKRAQKLLIYIAYNKEIPRPIPSEEEDLYIQVKKIINKEGAEVKASKIRILKTIPEIVTSSGNKIGPFEQNQTIYVSEMSDAKFIIDNKLGEIVE